MEHVLDVSMLEPCEPLELSLQKSRELPPGDYLRVIHRREPHLLYPLLEKLDLTWHCQPLAAASFNIYIWRCDDHAAETEVRQVLAERC